MAASQLTPVLQEFFDNSEVDLIRQQLNNVIAAINGITLKLDADAGVTDTNYTSLWGNQASQVEVHK